MTRLLRGVALLVSHGSPRAGEEPDSATCGDAALVDSNGEGLVASDDGALALVRGCAASARLPYSGELVDGLGE